MEIMLYIYLGSMLGVFIILVLDHLFSKYPDYFNYITIMGLAFVPFLNSWLVIDFIIGRLWEGIKYLYFAYRPTKYNKSSTPHIDYDSQSMYPGDIAMDKKDK